MVFEFLDDHKQKILAYLAAREGKDFALLPLTVRLDLGDKVIATVPVYEGKNVISSDEAKHLAELVLRANGRDGPCIRYVKGISEELRRLGIDDPAVRVTRSTRPASTSWVDGSDCCFMSIVRYSFDQPRQPSPRP